jgi:hypothetical protein
MAYRHMAHAAWASFLALSLCACAIAAHRPAPVPIADAAAGDAKILPGEFHNASIGQDRLRGALPLSE